MLGLPALRGGAVLPPRARPAPRPRAARRSTPSGERPATRARSQACCSRRPLPSGPVATGEDERAPRPGGDTCPRARLAPSRRRAPPADPDRAAAGESESKSMLLATRKLSEASQERIHYRRRRVEGLRRYRVPTGILACGASNPERAALGAALSGELDCLSYIIPPMPPIAPAML